MGIPKFYRYISERYPCLNETLKEHQIPEFDNLYLDVNGIIHGCSHPNDSDVSFRITEEAIFKNIFRYVEILFRMIRPQKLFFIAIDGVAPRAKINQQRGRRFRAAKDAEVQEAKAVAKGIEIPKEKRFDSNAITPGTAFMSKVNEHLRYFVTYKVSSDKLWQKCKVIFSGSEVPGEGEHKIMDYIRYIKAQPDYDKYTKHCLYGLDADLIMLGLCTHEVHFTLLREEVTYGKKQTKILTAEETKFCLFHLSLLREYINHEFSPLREKLPFPYDLEKIIDDWILMGFLVGNDFIPHLPNLHIAHGALSILYQVYMDVLPTLEGYINEAGTLKLDRFEKFMEKLSCFDVLKFSEHYADLKYLEGKIGRPLTETEKNQKKEDGEQGFSPRKMQDKEFNALLRAAVEMSLGSNEDELGDDESDSETYSMEFVQHKRDYYINKLKYEDINEDFLRSQAEGYVTALQWNLHYYYNGCCSWSWYYPHHYAPYISDIKDFKNLKLEFELGEPFLPFQQLLAVLPPYSKELLPSAFQTLLTEEQSPIIDYYPADFQTDLNGKRQEWEAVVLIPFINAQKLLDAMAPHYDKLTPDERSRNKHGPMYCYTYTEENLGVYKSLEYFPDIISHARSIPINREDIIVPREKLVKGLCPGVRIDLYFPGFPTLQYIEHTATLENAKIKVFERNSLRDSMILHIKKPSNELDLTSIASKLLGKTVFVNWPHITEAQVTGVSNCNTKLSLINPQMDYSSENINMEELKGSLVGQWNLIKKHITETYMGRLGIEVGEIDILVYVRPLMGSKYIFYDHGMLCLEKQWSETQTAHPYQMIVKDISVHCAEGAPYKTVEEVFAPESVCFMLGHPYYGAMGKVRDVAVCKKSGRINVSVFTTPEPPLERIKEIQAELRTHYMQGSIAARRLGISSLLLSRITGAIYVKKSSDEVQDDTKYNIGLNLKFNKRNEEIPGYTRKENGQWLYSSKVIELIRNYMVKCPDLFERLSKNITSDIFLEENLFNKDTGEMNDIIAWLKEQLQGVENRACGVEALDPSLVKNIENEIDSFFETHNASKIVELQVKPNLLFKPDSRLRNMQPDPKAQTRLLDRIRSVKENFTVPLGYKGTVIGIQRMENVLDTMYDVVFDKTFVGGLSISGCTEFRGYRLSPADFINISYGQRIRHCKTGTTETNAESIDASRLTPNQKAYSCANSSAFASYRKKNNFPTEPSTSPKLRIIQKTTNDTNQPGDFTTAACYKWKQYDRQEPKNVVNVQETYGTSKNVQPTPSQNTQQKVSTMKPTSEFQALWNELHKKQKPNEASQQTPMGSEVKQQVAKGFAENSPHDPSAFLKAMLKISDGNIQQNTQSGIPKTPSNNTVSEEENKTLDTPPLVQQLFDHARQTEKVQNDKIPTWYCTELMNYYQRLRGGMPRYSYFTDIETNLIRAHVLLPDRRVFVGDPCTNHEHAAGSAAKKVYRELRLADIMPQVKIAGPRLEDWSLNPRISFWSLNMRPPPPPTYPHYPPKPQPPPHHPQWTPKVQHNQGYQQQVPGGSKQSNQYNKHQQPQSKLDHTESKTEIKNSTSFVPLQAQKKSRNISNKQTAGKKDTNQCAKDNPQPAAQQKKKELPAKTTKVETVADTAISEKQKQAQSSSQVQNTQNVVKPKKSRVAAKFCTPSDGTVENQSKNTT